MYKWKYLDKRTQDALVASYHQWNDAANGGKGNVGSGSDCPLCKLFNRHSLCEGCPIQKFGKLDRHYCKNTPYGEWASHGHRDHGNSNGRPVGNCPKCKRSTTRFAKFIAHLIPGDVLNAIGGQNNETTT